MKRGRAFVVFGALALCACSGHASVQIDQGPSTDAGTNQHDADAASPDNTDAGLPGKWSWQSWPSVNEGRHAGGAATVNGRVYIFGGMAGQRESTRRLSSVERFDPSDNVWVAVEQMPSTSCCFASAALDGKIYVAGGYSAETNQATAELMIYDVAADSWSIGPSMPAPRANGAAFVHAGKVGVVGGWDEVGGGGKASILLFDPKAGAWSTMPTKLPTPRVSCLARVVDGALYIVGGYPDEPEPEKMYGTDLVERLDLVANTWSTAPPIGQARGQIGGGIIDGQLVIAGGYGWGHLPDAERLSVDGGSWQSLPDLATGRANPLTTVLDNKLVVIGGGEFMGGDGFKPMSSVEVLSFSTD